MIDLFIVLMLSLGGVNHTINKMSTKIVPYVSHFFKHSNRDMSIVQQATRVTSIYRHISFNTFQTSMLEGSEENNASESTGDIILEANNTDMEVNDLAR